MKIMFKLPKGKWTPLEVQDRHQLNAMRNGILKGAMVRVVDAEQPNTRLVNPSMQSICGYR